MLKYEFIQDALITAARDNKLRANKKQTSIDSSSTTKSTRSTASRYSWAAIVRIYLLVKRLRQKTATAKQQLALGNNNAGGGSRRPSVTGGGMEQQELMIMQQRDRENMVTVWKCTVKSQ